MYIAWVSYDPQAKAKALRARINTEKPTSQTLEMILAEALKEAWEAAQVPGKLNPEQEARAINVLRYAADGCSFAGSRNFTPGLSCAQDSGRGFNCSHCEARELIQELGYVLDKHGHWNLPKPV